MNKKLIFINQSHVHLPAWEFRFENLTLQRKSKIMRTIRNN